MENIDLTTLDWIGAIIWTIIGIAFFKACIFPHGHTKFSISRWLNENLADVIRGLLLTLVVMKIGDVIFQLLSFTGIDLTSLGDSIKEAGLDPVQFSLVVAIGFQYILYKRSKNRKSESTSNID